MAKITFNKLNEAKNYPKSFVFGIHLKPFIDVQDTKINELPITYGKTDFTVSGEYERDQDDLNLNFVIDDDDLEFSEDELSMIEDVILSKIVEYEEIVRRNKGENF